MVKYSPFLQKKKKNHMRKETNTAKNVPLEKGMIFFFKKRNFKVVSPIRFVDKYTYSSSSQVL